MQTLMDIFSRVMGVDRGKINDELSPQNSPEWDSFNWLLLISELEVNYKVKFTMEEVTNVNNYGDLKLLLKNHGVKKGID